jgi:magnesium transporter
MPSLPKPRLRRAARARGAVVPFPPEPETPRVETIESAGLRWINIERPRGADRVWLEEHFPEFHPLDFEDVFSRNQRPKVDEYDEYLFVVLHFPAFDKVVGRLNAAELDIFVGPDFVVTLPNEAMAPIEYLFEHCVDASFPMLGKMGHKLDSIEEDIFEGRNKEIVRDISNVKQEIINFRKIVRPQRAALRDLERTKRYIPEDLEVYFDDINDANERVWDLLENFKEVVDGLESTNESVISHGLNDVLRVLTAFSVILLPLTLISGIWGMNVHVPGEQSVEAFWVIIGLMVVVVVAMILFFRRRGWL